MKASTVILFLAIFLFLILVWALVAISGPDEYDKCATEHNQNSAQTIAKELSLTFVREVSFLDKHNGGIIALFTLALVFATLGLWDIGKRQLVHSRESSERQSRAYVFLESISFGNELAVSTKTINYIKPIVKWTNSGATPAKNVVACCNFVFSDVRQSDNFKFPDGLRENFEMGPNSSFASHSLNIPVGNVANADSDKCTLFIWGWIDYDDVFSTKRRRTEFNREVKVSKAADGEPTYFFSPIAAGKFNGSDETCTRNPGPYKKA